jgi:hypothetical protein
MSSDRLRALTPLGVVLGLAILGTGPTSAVRAELAGQPAPDHSLSVAALDTQVRSFLAGEMAAHLSGAQPLNPPPARVHGALTTGEYTWGTFMRAVAAYAQLSGDATLAGRDVARTIGEIGLLEVRLGGTRFSQLYAGLSLRHFGSDLSRNRVWQSLSPAERESWLTLLDATRFYDPVKREVINLPENYLGVAARISAMAWDTGRLKDRALLDSILDRAARQFTEGALYADDGLPTGRYDRYSNEYVRYVWEAAQIADRQDLLEALRPSLRAQMRLWWDLVGPDGYGYTWGRSLGLVSYLDTLEIAGFLAINPEFRPAPLEQLAAAYHRAWRWLRSDYKDDRHLLSLFDFGRGNFSYISIDREWQQTVGALGKLAHAHIQLMSGLRQASVTQLPSRPTLPDVTRFEFFKQRGRQAGVWLVRQGLMRFALPITTATRPGVADYLPAPHGLPGFSVPVEQQVPALVPFLELEDGRTIVAADGADAIEVAPDGRTLRARWTHWALIGGKAGERVDPGIESAVEWTIDGPRLVRTERLTSNRAVRVRRWRVSVPTTGTAWLTEFKDGTRTNTFLGPEAALSVAVPAADWPCTVRGEATGNAPVGRGARLPVPLHLVLESNDLALRPGITRQWRLEIAVAAPEERPPAATRNR